MNARPSCWQTVLGGGGPVQLMMSVLLKTSLSLQNTRVTSVAHPGVLQKNSCTGSCPPVTSYIYEVTHINWKETSIFWWREWHKQERKYLELQSLESIEWVWEHTAAERGRFALSRQNYKLNLRLMVEIGPNLKLVYCQKPTFHERDQYCEAFLGCTVGDTFSFPSET